MRPQLTEVLVEESADAIRWMHSKGIRWTLLVEGQSFEMDGRRKFWGGLVLGTLGEGKGLVEQHTAAAERSGVEIAYNTRALSLTTDERGEVVGAVCATSNGELAVRAKAVVLACGGFESDPQQRVQHLGPQWDLAKVRGTPCNTGDGHVMARAVGAATAGHWSGCHSVAWEASAPLRHGDRHLTYALTKHMYPLGIVVNSNAERFLDEGADLRGFTYAEYGARVLEQPGAIAHQIFDAKIRPLLRKDQYDVAGASASEANTLAELAVKLGLDADTFQQTVEAFNGSIVSGGTFDPTEKDGIHTDGISPPKSNWAQPIDTPPFYGYTVTCGITFSFGGMSGDASGRVLDAAARPLPGLYVAGELLGGILYHNYPAGSGLTSGSVFGRRAGAAAGHYANRVTA